MELLLTDEQRMLQDSAAKFFERQGGVKRARGLRNTGPGFDREVLAAMGNEGWLGLLTPAEHGGLELGMTELALILEQAGRTLAPEPVGAAALAGATLARTAQTSDVQAMAGRAMAGGLVVLPAIDDESAADGHTAPTLLAERDSADRIRISGRRCGVVAADAADLLLVSARHGAEDLLCAVPAGASGLAIDTHQTVDGRTYGNTTFCDVEPTEVLARGSSATAIVQRLRDQLMVACAAELLGVMTAALDMTVDYLKTRRQFGKPIGSFQALQHRAVDDFTQIISVRSLLFQAAAQGEGLLPATAAALKAHAAETALAVTKSAIQMHGAIGFTHEHDAGLYLKRAMWLSAWMGNAAVQRRRYARLTAG